MSNEQYLIYTVPIVVIGALKAFIKGDTSLGAASNMVNSQGRFITGLTLHPESKPLSLYV